MSTRDILIDICEDTNDIGALIGRLLAEVRKLREQLGSESQAQSSVQVNTSARGFDITVKAYVGSPVREAGDAALEEYLRLRAEIERRLMGEAA